MMPLSKTSGGVKLLGKVANLHGKCQSLGDSSVMTGENPPSDNPSQLPTTNSPPPECFYSRRKLISCLVFIVLPMLIVIFALLSIKFPCMAPQIPFDSAKWQDKDVDEIQWGENRHRMIKDLVRNHLKKGMTKDEVKKLLGQPDYGTDTPESLKNYDIEVFWDYHIDPMTDECFFATCGHLMVGFDNKGYYRRSYVRRQ